MESIIFKTLLHSLWQGLILALLTAAVLIFTHKSTARLRYNLLISCLMLFSVSILGSFIYEWNTEATIIDTRTTVHTKGFSALPWASFTFPSLDSGESPAGKAVGQPWLWIQNGWSYFNTYASTIVLLWLLVIAAKSVQLFAGLYSIKRIRNTKTTAAGFYWENRVQQLAIHFGIYKMVSIVQSGFVQVPMVVGYFKPLILIPIGLLNNLSKEEVEAIICHELAHVKRRDYLVNILQSFMELLFFFNPAVLWVSRLIREERESCCDDLAVLNTNNKAGYIRALVSCEEFQMNKPEYAMAMADHPQQLLKRVNRMVTKDTGRLTKMEQRIMGATLVAALTLCMAFSSAFQRPTPQSIQKAAPKAVKVQQTHALENEASGKSVSIVNKVVAATEKVLVETGNKLFAVGKTKTVTERAESETAKSTITKKFVADDENARRYNEKIHENILDELIKDGLVERKENLSFEMNKDHFSLNDENLPEEIRKKYVKKYIKSPDWIIYYKQEFESK